MAEKKNIDWDALKNEYISSPDESFRSLGEKWGVSASAIHRRAKEGGWARKREQFADKMETKTLEKLMEERAKGEVARLKRLYDATDKLTKKVADGISKVQPTNTLAIRQLVSSLKELRAMEGIAPIAHESDDGEGGIVILADVNEVLTPPEETESEGESDVKS